MKFNEQRDTKCVARVQTVQFCAPGKRGTCKLLISDIFASNSFILVLLDVCDDYMFVLFICTKNYRYYIKSTDSSCSVVISESQIRVLLRLL